MQQGNVDKKIFRWQQLIAHSGFLPSNENLLMKTF
jgi:hypothetical protein